MSTPCGYQSARRRQAARGGVAAAVLATAATIAPIAAADTATPQTPPGATDVASLPDASGTAATHPAPAPGEGNVTAQGTYPRVIGRIDVHGLALSHGRYTFPREGNRHQPGASVVTGDSPTTWSDDSHYSWREIPDIGNNVADVEFVYRIEGSTRDVWIKGVGFSRWVPFFPNYHYSSCDVFEGDPDIGGVPLANVALPFRCDMASSGDSPWKVNFTISWGAVDGRSTQVETTDGATTF